ncbi:hypothetical protein D1872_275750 [compost metagenome]
MSLEFPSTIMVTRQGTRPNVMSGFQTANASSPKLNVMSRCSPGASSSFRNALSSAMRRVMPDSRARIYNWTVSDPTRLPVFFSLTVTVTLPPSASSAAEMSDCDRRGSPYSNSV